MVIVALVTLDVFRPSAPRECKIDLPFSCKDFVFREGGFELTLNGVKHELHAGDILVIPSNVTHSGKSITDCEIIDVFHPVRDDYQQKQKM